MEKHKEIVRRANLLKETLIDLRREFHQQPEVGLQTFQTAGRIEAFLREQDIETQMLANGAAVRGLLNGRFPGKTVALRADIDALPLQEEGQVPYRSKVAGAMHGCGHDAHAAMLLGAAKILAEERKNLKGRVVFLFQPAEETGEGARRMVDEGCLEGVDAVFGLHVSTTFDLGTLGYRSGPLMAAGDFFDVKITGKGGHGGLPHEAIDPIVAAAQAITALQSVVSREIDPLESAVLSICKMEAGQGAYNVIPDTASFGGTLRSHAPRLRPYLQRRVKEVVEGVVSAMRGGYEVRVMERFAPTINDEGMTRFFVEVAQNVLGAEKVFEMKPLLGCEDFSCYLEKVPGCFSFLGAKNEEKGMTYPHHHPRFDIDEDVLPLGTALHVAVALEYLTSR